MDEATDVVESEEGTADVNKSEEGAADIDASEERAAAGHGTREAAADETRGNATGIETIGAAATETKWRSLSLTSTEKPEGCG